MDFSSPDSRACGFSGKRKSYVFGQSNTACEFLFKFLKSPIWTVAGHENFPLTKVVRFAYVTKDVIHGFYLLHAHLVWSVNDPYSIIFCTTSKQNTFNNRAC